MTSWRGLLLLGLLVSSTVQEPLTVTLFYESLCPDSINFIITQLYPTYVDLTSQYLQVFFVPYGNATQRISPAGIWSFDCEHGPDECVANEMQICALSLIQSNTKKVRFVRCVMSSTYPPTSGAKCAMQIGLDFDQVLYCMNKSSVGDNEMATLGYLTTNYDPPINIIPAVAFNWIYNEDEQASAKSNFKQTVCDRLRDPKPATCYQ